MTTETPRTIRIAAADLNGHPRGKRVPSSYLGKLEGGAVRMPLSALNVDIFGADIDDSPLVFATGDADGTLYPTGRGPVPMPWLAEPSLLVPMRMTWKGGVDFPGDPRNALAAILERYAAKGWKVIAATELEFTLVDNSGARLGLAADPASGKTLKREDVLSLRTLDAFDAFFTDLYAGAEVMGIPAQAAISESGIGQFEINLAHSEAMEAADNTWLFKELVKGLARKHGSTATFMAKPFADDAGNGMHVHFSVVDAAGANQFDDGGDKGTETLRQAVQGCLAAMTASTLAFAPHRVSYDRFVDAAHAPTSIGWGYENRTAAIRIPGGPPAARRIEHRVAGGDVNPYLLLAAILGAALNGIESKAPPPPPVVGNAYEADLPQLAPDWPTAIEAFAHAPEIARIFHPDLIRNLVLTKRQELRKTKDMDAKALSDLYLDMA